MLQRVTLVAFLICSVSPQGARGDEGFGLKRPVVIPQVGVLQRGVTPRVTLDRVTATIDANGSTVTTRLDVKLSINGKSPVACDLLVPIPRKAALLSVLPSGDGSSKLRAGLQLRTGNAAKNTWRRLVANTGRTSPLEFYGANIVVVRSLSFRGAEKPVIHVRYRESLKSEPVMNYLLPKSERLLYATPWSVSAAVRARKPVTAIYCASHPVTTVCAINGSVSATVPGNATSEPGPFRLSWTTGGVGLAGLVLAYPPQQKKDGYFLWLVQAPRSAPATNPIKREVTLVIDRSASMDGKRIQQVRGVVNTVLETLGSGDSFNIITYNQTVDTLAKTHLGNTAATVKTAKTYLKNIKPRGGSNIYGALKTSLAQPVTKGRLPLVLFFTDGLPTSGSASEVKIRNLAVKQNPYRRRIYAVGIGADLISPLLNGIATATGGQSVFVLPKQSIASVVTPVVNRLLQPILTDAGFQTLTTNGKSAKHLFRDISPLEIPDLFAGDRLVILGRYRGTERRSLLLTGNYLGERKSFRFGFDPKSASTLHSFLPRLWASRRIGQLVETIRQDGAASRASYSVRVKKTDPKLLQRSKEVLELTARYGILTEYTAFLSRGYVYPFGQRNVFHQIAKNFDNRAVRSRAGIGAVNQEKNNISQSQQFRLNSRNGFWNDKMARENVGRVQQIGTLSFFRQKNRWVDGRLLIRSKIPPVKTIIAFGSSEHWKLLEELSDERLQGALALQGDVLLLHRGKPLLVVGPKSGRK